MEKFKDVRMTDMRLSLLRQLNEFHQLDTLLLYQLVKDDLKKLVNYDWFQRTLKFEREQAGHIFLPDAQKETFNVDYKRYVYQLTDRGKAVLTRFETPLFNFADYGLRWSYFTHDWMTTHCIASLKLAAGDKYLPPWKVTRQSSVFEYDGMKLLPDYPLFGLKGRYFIWETDCCSETVTEVARKLRTYIKLGQQDYYWKRFNIDDIYILFITTNEIHMRDIMKAVGKSERVLYRFVPHFGTCEFTPEPMPQLWHDPWEREGCPPFSLKES